MVRAFLLAAWLAIAASAAGAADAPIAWDDLMALKTRQAGDQTVIDIAPALTALNGKQATIRGWITPINLGDGGTVTSFLLTGTLGTCPFCLGIGPEGFVLISAAEPVPADITTELLLRGRFEVSRDDPTGFYYRLRDARVIGHP